MDNEYKEILFWKVFRNIYLNNIIFSYFSKKLNYHKLNHIQYLINHYTNAKEIIIDKIKSKGKISFEGIETIDFTKCPDLYENTIENQNFYKLLYQYCPEVSIIFLQDCLVSGNVSAIKSIYKDNQLKLKEVLNHSTVLFLDLLKVNLNINQLNYYKMIKFLLSNKLIDNQNILIKKINLFSISIKLKYILKLCNRYEVDSIKFSNGQLNQSIIQLFNSNNIEPKSIILNNNSNNNNNNNINSNSTIYSFVTSKSKKLLIEKNDININNENNIDTQLLNYLKIIYNGNFNLLPLEYYFFFENSYNLPYLYKRYKSKDLKNYILNKYNQCGGTTEKLQFIIKYYRGFQYIFTFRKWLMKSILLDQNQDDIIAILISLHRNERILSLLVLSNIPYIIKRINSIKILTFFFYHYHQNFLYNNNEYWKYVPNLELLKAYENSMVRRKNKFSFGLENYKPKKSWNFVYEKLLNAINNPNLYETDKTIIKINKNDPIIKEYINQGKKEIIDQILKNTNKFELI